MYSENYNTLISWLSITECIVKSNAQPMDTNQAINREKGATSERSSGIFWLCDSDVINATERMTQDVSKSVVFILMVSSLYSPLHRAPQIESRE